MHAAASDPLIAEKLALERRLGGHTATVKRLPADVPGTDYRSRAGIRALLESTTNAVLAGVIAPSQANSVAQLAGVALRLAEIELDALELALTQTLLKDGDRPQVTVVGEEHLDAK